MSKVTEQVVTGQRPDPGSPKALSSVLSTAPCGLWYHQGYKQDPRNKEDKVSHVRGGQKAIFRSELWRLGGGEAGPWAGPPASLSLSFLLCKEGTTASQGRLKMKGGMAAQLRFLLPIVLWLTERHRKPRNSMSEKEFQCWTGEWVATAQPLFEVFYFHLQAWVPMLCHGKSPKDSRRIAERSHPEHSG